LLKSFSGERTELSLGELALSAGLKKSTAYRLLTALEREGMVARSSQSDLYHLGPEILALGGRALRSNDLRAASRLELERLAGQTGETVTLEILVGAEVLILDEVLGSHLIGTTPSIGTRWPAWATSTGKVLLAHLDENELEAVLEQMGSRFSTLQQREQFRAELRQVARQGYATAVEELEPGFVALGAPLRNLREEVVAAISAGGPSTRITSTRLAELAPQVKSSAELISRNLGFIPPDRAGT
jgi:DNA-binding IclR family transcriptional regulator